MVLAVSSFVVLQRNLPLSMENGEFWLSPPFLHWDDFKKGFESHYQVIISVGLSWSQLSSGCCVSALASPALEIFLQCIGVDKLLQRGIFQAEGEQWVTGWDWHLTGVPVLQRASGTAGVMALSWDKGAAACDHRVKGSAASGTQQCHFLACCSSAEEEEEYK